MGHVTQQRREQRGLARSGATADDEGHLGPHEGEQQRGHLVVHRAAGDEVAETDSQAARHTQAQVCAMVDERRQHRMQSHPAGQDGVDVGARVVEAPAAGSSHAHGERASLGLGEPGALALDGAYESYTALAGPTWRNEIDSSIGLQVLGVRTTAAAKKLRCPLLVQIADFDRGAPPHAAADAAFKAHAEVRHYPCDHFDIFAGHDWFEPAVEHEIAFLTRHLA